jgi:hypothetical protein
MALLEYHLNKEPDPGKPNGVWHSNGLTGIDRASRSLDQITDPRFRHRP